jgi:hypothetical protein
MPPRVAPDNFVFVDPPTTPEVVQVAVVRSLLDRNRTADGRLRLSATLARLFRREMEMRQSLLDEHDLELLQVLLEFTEAWNEMERASWRALAFHEARARRTRPPRVEAKRREPQAREPRPARRQRTTTAARGSPSSRSSEDDDPPDLAGPRPDPRRAVSA